MTKRAFFHRNQTFTLIELLVVVAIIAILASLLLPALSKAKGASESADCKSKLKQIAMAEFMYMADYNGWSARNIWQGDPWCFYLSDYLEQGSYYAENKGTSKRNLGLRPELRCKTSGYKYYGKNKFTVSYRPADAAAPEILWFYADGYDPYMIVNRWWSKATVRWNHGTGKGSHPFGKANVLLLDGHVDDCTYETKPKTPNGFDNSKYFNPLKNN